MHTFSVLIAPFLDYSFMRRALAGCLALALGCGPIGTFLVLRRMSLIGYALCHAVLPGAAVGLLLGGLSVVALAAGGLLSGLAVALSAGFISRLTTQGEDASFTVLYNTAIALGVVLISAFAPSSDLIGLLFGNILAMDDTALLLLACSATLTTLTLAVIYRPLVAECFDPLYLAAARGRGALVQAIFLALVVLNLVSAFESLGVLMAVGLLIVPAVSARFWVGGVGALCAISAGLAFVSGYAGLAASYALNQPSGPTIVLVAGVLYGGSVLAGKRGGLLRKRRARLASDMR